MFSSVCHTFAHSVGSEEDKIQGCQSVEQAESINSPLCVLVKKRCGYLWWKKTKFNPAGFQLNDLILRGKEKPLKFDVHKNKVMDWNKNLTLSLEGDVGAKILEELGDVTLEGKDEVTISAALGAVSLTFVPRENILDQLRNRQFDLNHQYLKQIQQNKKLKLCLAEKLYQSENGGTIDRVKEEGTNIHADVHATTEVNVNTGGKIDSKDKSDITLAPGTTLAFKVLDLQVGEKSGRIVPCWVLRYPCGFIPDSKLTSHPSSLLDRQSPSGGDEVDSPLETDSADVSEPDFAADGLQASLETDSADVSEPDFAADGLQASLENLYQDIDSLKSLADDRQKALRAMFFHAAHKDFTAIRDIVDHMEYILVESRDELKRMCDAAHCDLTRNFLSVLGDLKMDSDDQPFQTVITLYEAAVDLNPELFTLVQQVEARYVDTILLLLRSTMLNERILPPVAMETASTWGSEVKARQLLDKLHYFSNKGAVEHVTPELSSPHIEQVFLLLRAMFVVTVHYMRQC